MKINAININNPINETAEKISPFAVVNGEYINSNITTEYGYSFPLHEEDKLILIVTNKFLLLTSALIEKILTNHGMEITQHEIQLRLRKLSNSQYLDKMEFCSENGKSSSKFYKVGYRGRGFLKSMNIKPNHPNYIAEIDATQAKKILSSVQYLIRSNTDFDSINVCMACFVPSENENEKATEIFRSQATIQTENTSIFVEAVRNNTSIEDLKNKLNRMNRVFMSPQTNIRCVNPTLVLICENLHHMLSTMKRIRKHIHCNFDVYYTCDTAVYEDANNLYRSQSFLEMLLAV